MTINCRDLDREGHPCCKCSSCLSIIEERFDRDTIVLDGSSFSGKDDVVSFGQAAEAMPMFDKKKVLIIEEADQLSAQAKNAMLKLLERPREHVVFILLSMVNGGVPVAIQSRCQTYSFKPFSTQEVMMALKGVMDRSGVWEDKEIPNSFKLQGVAAISTAARGSLREAIQYYEKCLIGKYYTPELIRENLGLVDEETIASLLGKLLNKDLSFFNDIYSIDINEFFSIAYSGLSDAFIYKLAGFTKNSYYEKTIAGMSTATELESLLDLFTSISENNSKPYLPKSYFYTKIATWFSSKKTRLKEETPSPRPGRMPV